MRRLYPGILAIMLVASTVFGDVSCRLGSAGEGGADMRELIISFEWRGSGCQLSSPSPELRVSGAPEGTAFLRVRMTDLDKPNFDHGGGTVDFDGSGAVAAGSLRDYRGPCPPSGSHTYRFDVEALAADRSSVLGRGSAERRYP